MQSDLQNEVWGVLRVWTRANPAGPASAAVRSEAATSYSWMRPPRSSELTSLAAFHTAQTINECEVQRAAAAAAIV